ncbi:MAG TPA: chemotaxis protein CheW [Xanthomonadales bacterium]|nr:chemotaxis protein CheW [Xanthomonadales bacterium]
MTAKSDKAAFRKLQEYQRRSEVFQPGKGASGNHSQEWSGVTFRLSGNRLACNIERVQEILPLTPSTPVPGSKPWILGLANVRGNLMTIVDLAWFLYGNRTQVTPRSRLLATGPQKSPVGLLIDEIYGQRHFLNSDATEADLPADSPLRGLVKRQHLLGSEPWQELELEQLFKSTEFLNGAAS